MADHDAPKSPAAFKDHFSTHASGYAAHRPTYPRALVDALANVAPDTRVALDCGCGTGQLSVLLAERFAHVVATDASAGQIDHARPHPQVKYRVAKAEHSGLPASSVDLVTVAQAAHWLDLEPFYEEVRRVARPGAILALITYGVLHVEGDVDEQVQRFYWDTVGPHWPPERRHVEDGYRSLPFPFAEVPVPPVTMEVLWRREDLLGYVDTWSAMRALEKAAGREPFDAFASALAQSWGPSEQRRRVRWPLALRVGRVST
ncbi:class I SAM-dependent methyltransferase [Stigmatella sp. ncwal1]|uniref:Class I SAM-dependent methyltransferase n=1 Tax=Stigmatella ashevillensis TaxID=2995309 RepID=A0ABT5DFX5_9BACT|nr:class I SAM-dependent methyltransferase [Stigmatella ashevillena]MDC0712574.1 class I SAM-dependent methyltransferase [Stigmatella ashevillena]